MSEISPIALVLGAGANVGMSVAKRFIEKGYKVGLASRSATHAIDSKNVIHIQSDLTDPNAVAQAFSTIVDKWGVPSVVIYNAYRSTHNPIDDPLALPLDDFNRDLAVNTTSAFVAARQAVIGFRQLPDSASKTFLYTGNMLNNATIGPWLLSLGMGKSATAHMIQSAATLYKDQGYKFYYCDEREEDGTPMYSGVNGSAHAELYIELAESKEQGEWQQTFVNGVGYRTFPRT